MRAFHMRGGKAGIRALRMAAAVASGSMASVLLVMGPAAAEGEVNLLENGSFEEPVGGFQLIDADESLALTQWGTTDTAIEFWPGTWAPGATDGNQFLELNAYTNGAIYQDVTTIPSQTLTWSLQHSARTVDTESVAVLIGPGGGIGIVGLVGQDPLTRNGNPVAPQTTISDPKLSWGLWSGTYVVPAGQTSTRFAVQALTWGRDPSFGNLLDDVKLMAGGPPPLVGGDNSGGRGAGSSTAPARTFTLRWVPSEPGACWPTVSGVGGTWVQLTVGSCASPTGPYGATLLGWATSPNFPVARAADGVAVDADVDGVRMVFIPVDGYAFLSGDNTLYPIWTK